MLAWLHQTPTDARAPNARLYPGVGLPAVAPACAHLPEWLEELGVVGHGGLGMVPLTYAEIGAWSAATAQPLRADEVRALRSMSAAYAAQANGDGSRCPIEDAGVREAIDLANAATWVAMAERA